MRIVLFVAGVYGLYAGRLFYCGSRIKSESTSASIVQKLVLQRILDRHQLCTCTEMRVGYSIRLRSGVVANHIAHYDVSEKTLRIEPDPGSGWAFGPDGIDEGLIQQVLRDGGQFSTSINYRPNGKHNPSQWLEPF